MKQAVYILWTKVLTLFFYVFRIFPIDRKKIVFSSYAGKGFGDNSKYISIKLHEKNPDIKMYWILRKGVVGELPSWITPVKMGSISMVYIMTTASVWVDNTRKSRYVRKRKGQYYIQTWHGGIALKKVERDAKLPEAWNKVSKHDSRMIDVMISNSQLCTEMYRRAFWYDGPIYEWGSPRNDILFNENEEKFSWIKSKIKASDDEYIILYAPTFRDIKRDVYDIDVTRVIEAFKKKTNKSVKFYVRLHPLMKAREYCICHNSAVIDVTNYPDMYELLSVTDALITDYSSCMFDMIFGKKETYLYAPDVDDYSEERGLQFDLRELPFPLAENNEQLLDNINKFNMNDYSSKIDRFIEIVGLKEYGTASENVAKLINDQIK